MHIVDIITKKRDGHELNDLEIKFVIDGYTNGDIPDYQISSFLMAIYFKGMTDKEATSLALAMRDSGDVIDLNMIDGIKVDKHSTGGVGDKVTLVLGPLVASLGAKFAKMSGRGLGHTGGTIDKLESIPGYKVELPIERFIKQVQDIGISVVGQSGEVAPADKKLYALRDVTATVDSIPLIAASIMSKKLASGADAICLDVKVGSGAFMKNIDDASKLSNLMVSIGKLAGKKMTAIITGMDEPLGHKIGNSLEVYEAIETLNGNGPKDLVEVCLVIGSHLLVDAKIASTLEEARLKLERSINDGSGLSKFKQLIEAQGGDSSIVDNKEILVSANKEEVYAKSSGYIERIDALTVGKAGMLLGAGRETKDDVIDLSVGIDLHKKIGDYVDKGEKLATLYVGKKNIREAKDLLISAIQIGDKKNKVDLIKKIIRF